MGKKKVSIIVTAVLVCMVCISMIAGATFALFSDNDRVDVSVTTAKLAVSAEIDSIATGSTLGAENSQLQAGYENKMLTVNNMLPGDVVTFQVTITSEATVDVLYRLSFGAAQSGVGSQELFDELLLGVKDAASDPYTYYVSSVSAWTQLNYSETAADMTVTKLVAIELPAYVSNQALQGQTCNIEFAVEAVQGNASVSGEAQAVVAHRVTNNEQLNAAVAAAANGDAIVLDSMTATDWELTYAGEAKTFSVKGCNVGNLIVNAPNATITYDIAQTDSITVSAVAGDSMYISGEVGTLTVNEGHVVVESTAAITNSFVVEPSENKTAAIEIKTSNVKPVTVGENTKGAASIVIDEKVEAPVSVVFNNVEGSATVNNNSEAAIEISGIDTAEKLIEALRCGGSVVLAGDIESSEQVIVPEGVTADLDLSGYKFVSTYLGGGFINCGTLTIRDSVGTGLIYNDSCRNFVPNERPQAHAISNASGGTLTIVNGRFGDDDFDDDNVNDSTWGAALYNEGVAVIEDGYFTCLDNRSHPINGKSYGFFSYAIRSTGTLTINGGKVYGNMNGGVAADNGIIYINGGDFQCVKPNNWYVLVTSSANQSKIEVTGGIFTKEGANGGLLGGFNGMLSWDASEALEENGYTILGGTFVTPDGTITYNNDAVTYNVKTAALFKKALASTYAETTIVLENDIAVSNNNQAIPVNHSLSVDLNNNVLSGNFCLDVLDGVKLTIVNGTLDIQSAAVAGYSGLYVKTGGELLLEGVTFNSNGYAIYAEGSKATGVKGIATVRNCAIDAAYAAIGTNASDNGDRSPVAITFVGTKITSKCCGILINVPGELTIEDCTITATDQAVLARGGATVIKNSTLTTLSTGTWAQGGTDKDWKNGTWVSTGALVLGNKNNTAYKYPTTVALENVELIGSETAPAIYMWSDTDYDCNLTYDQATAEKINGRVFVSGNHSYVNGVRAVGSEEALTAALNDGASNIVLQNDVTVPDGICYTVTSDVVLDLGGHTLNLCGYSSDSGRSYVMYFNNITATICNGKLIAGYNNITVEQNANVTLRDITLESWGTQAVYITATGGTCTLESGKYMFSYLENQNGYLYGTGVNYSVYPLLDEIRDLNGNQINPEGSKVELVYSKEHHGVIVEVDGEAFVDNNNNAAQMNRFLLNCNDTAYANGTAQIIVKGGEFVNFNPACNVAEGEGTNFVAEGYSVVYQKNAEGNLIFRVVATSEVEAMVAAGWTLDE